MVAAVAGTAAAVIAAAAVAGRPGALPGTRERRHRACVASRPDPDEAMSPMFNARAQTPLSGAAADGSFRRRSPSQRYISAPPWQ